MAALFAVVGNLTLAWINRRAGAVALRPWVDPDGQAAGL